MVDRPIPLMTAKQAEAAVRALALDSAKIIVTDHAVERMEDRGFDDTDLFRVLEQGNVMDPPSRTQHGDWKCKVVKRLRGTRDTGVVTVIARNDRLIIVTMEWEDVR